MNIACFIAEEGIKQGASSSLCTFQVFLIQMYGHSSQFLHELERC